MTLASMAELVLPASRDRRAVGAFNVIQLEHAEGIVAGAERAARPVVLQLSENTARYHGSLAPLALACLRIAAEASVPVCVHLDHATRRELVEQAVELGVPSVMVDASGHPYEKNVAVTAELTAWCHTRGVWVEAELGAIGGKDGAHKPGVRTDPDDAAAFVAATGVDALAVAVGSSHAMLTRDAVLDDDLIAAIAAKVPVPLVLHGSSGVSEAGLRSAVASGMSKINIATHLNAALTGAVRRALAADEDLVDPRRYLGPGRDAVANQVAHLVTLLAP
ncbi:class II fructose-bisphosphate aldolase [Micromonospora sp. BL4]|uniref:class II fructose-bisphosphate aldolase n=1 Tax=Micromonospora sp. BL4 TaxID=2478710 RepID=UPI000EF56E31|nr:class II fructose-bisphosphate aldolase [Micromonospora sp. BL4]RLP94684.1 class II fructose-bisphosphate aldolase [Micromonospora sp. BL4]